MGNGALNAHNAAGFGVISDSGQLAISTSADIVFAAPGLSFFGAAQIEINSDAIPFNEQLTSGGSSVNPALGPGPYTRITAAGGQLDANGLGSFSGDFQFQQRSVNGQSLVLLAGNNVTSNPGDPLMLNSETLSGFMTTGLYSLVTAQSITDSDADGLSDFDEIKLYGTNPALANSDGDIYGDGFEIAVGSNPLDGTSLPKPDGDANGDGMVDAGDLVLAVRILTGQHVPSIAEKARWDVAPLAGGAPLPDLENTTADLLLLQRLVLGTLSF